MWCHQVVPDAWWCPVNGKDAQCSLPTITCCPLVLVGAHCSVVLSAQYGGLVPAAWWCSWPCGAHCPLVPDGYCTVVSGCTCCLMVPSRVTGVSCSPPLPPGTLWCMVPVVAQCPLVFTALCRCLVPTSACLCPVMPAAYKYYRNFTPTTKDSFC